MLCSRLRPWIRVSALVTAWEPLPIVSRVVATGSIAAIGTVLAIGTVTGVGTVVAVGTVAAIGSVLVIANVVVLGSVVATGPVAALRPVPAAGTMPAPVLLATVPQAVCRARPATPVGPDLLASSADPPGQILDPGHAKPHKSRRQRAEQRIRGPGGPGETQPGHHEHGENDRSDPSQRTAPPRIAPRPHHGQAGAHHHGDDCHGLHQVQRVARDRPEVRTGKRPGSAERLRGERVSGQDHRGHRRQGAGNQPHTEPGGLASRGKLNQAPGEPQRRQQQRGQLDCPKRGRTETTGEAHALRR